MKPTRNLFVSLLTLSAITLCGSHSAHAAIRTWDAGGDGSTWSTANGAGNAFKNNWDGATNGTAFNDGDDVVFGGASGLSPTTVAAYTVASITFNNTAGAFTLGGAQLTLGGDVINNDTDLQTINMDLLLSATRTFNAASGDLRVGGIIDDGASTFGLTKTGSGVLTLTAANTYNGDTRINAGTLKLDGNASVLSTKIIVGDTGINGASLDVSTNTVSGGFQVTGTQTLSGTGTVIGASTIQLNGIVAPGNSGAGVLNTGNIDFASNSVLQIDLNGINPGTPTPGTNYDQLKVTGGVTLAGLLTVDTTGYTQNNGDLFFVVVNDFADAINGGFSNAPEGSTVTLGSQQFAVTYLGNYDTDNSIFSFTGGNDFVMMTVPEPSAALLGGLGALFLLRRRRNA